MKLNKINLCLMLILGVCYFIQCKKDNSSKILILYDKPLSEIQANIYGNWKLHYGRGGICATCVQKYNNVFWKFTSGNKVQQTSNNSIYTDTTITWVRSPGTFTNGSQTFIMNFYDKKGFPSNYVVEQILNDTLILHDNSADAVFYHLTKAY